MESADTLLQPASAQYWNFSPEPGTTRSVTGAPWGSDCDFVTSPEVVMFDFTVSAYRVLSADVSAARANCPSISSTSIPACPTDPASWKWVAPSFTPSGEFGYSPARRDLKRNRVMYAWP